MQLRGRFITFTVQGEGAKMRLVAFSPTAPKTMEMVWFRRIQQIKGAYLPGTEYVVFGKPAIFNNRLSMTHPEVDSAQKVAASEKMRGVYPLTERLRTRNVGLPAILRLDQRRAGRASEYWRDPAMRPLSARSG